MKIKKTGIVQAIFFVLAAGILNVSTAFSQKAETVETVKSVASYVIMHTSFRFSDSKTNRSVTTTKELTEPDNDVKVESVLNKWQYPNGVLALGMLQTAAVLNNKTYADYALKNYDFVFSNLAYFQNQYKTNPKSEWAGFFRMNALDDCGALAAGLADVNLLAHKKAYQEYLERTGEYILHQQARLKDGTLCRLDPRVMTLWADDLYMSVPFLVRMGKITGDSRYYDDAVKQVINFNKYLYDPNTGLYFHCWYSDNNLNGVVRWLRCNGWVAMAQVELLNELPVSYPQRGELIRLLQRQIVGFSRYQDKSGLWHQLLDKPDSYLETSGSAMFIYAVAKAVNEGWINRSYATIAVNGWKALRTKISSDGQIQDVCIGTGIEDNIATYYERPTPLNDFHGFGPVLLAGAEMIRTEKSIKK